ncbi:MAG: 4Fe-4S dicluster domain-containing protein [Gemmatimonadaceae bacterium]|nr:4Fe-4S dicluster domain-containing protein [Gemmatimonadaceae bacterium]
MSTESGATGVKRRDFLKVLGVTTAATTVTGCNTDYVRKLIPYVASPDATVPGVSNYFASTCRECAVSCGILVETRDGRALKVEGNPNTAINRGALCAKGQAALQGLYNPDRFRGPMARKNGQLTAITWDEALQTLATRLGEVRSKGQAASAVFINQHEIGSFPAFLDGWLASYGMPAHISYDADAPHAAIAAHKAAYGVAWPTFDFDAATLVVSFGADFLDGWGPSVPLQLAWADARAKIEGAPRAIYIGARRSLTGLNADTWIPARPGSELAIIQFLRGSKSVADAASASDVSAATLEELKAEITGARRSLLLAGGNAADSAAVAVEVAEYNKALGNVGTSIKPASPLGIYQRLDVPAAVYNVAERMNAGAVPVLFVRGANPVHTLPKSVKFAEGLAKVGFKVAFTSVPDETAELADLVLPDHHSLESWGDAEPTPNVLHLQQPSMEPVFKSRATADVLMDVAKKDPALAAKYPLKDYRSFIVARFPGGQSAHTVALAKGVAAGASLRAAERTTGDFTRKPVAAFAGAGDFHLVINPSPTLGTGAGANKPWLMELPDPVSKVAWQSWVEMHPMACKKLGVTRGDLVTIETAAGKVTLPVYNYLGIRPDTIAVSLGYGHKSQAGRKYDPDADRKVPFFTGYGRYAEGVGINAVDLVSGDTDAVAGSIAYTSMKAKVTKTGDNVELITTEGSARQHSRGIGQAITLAALIEGRTKKEGAGEGHAPATTTEHHGETAEHGATGPKEWGEQEHEFVGGAPHEFLPGLKSPVANDAQGDLGDPDSKAKGMYSEQHWSGMAKRRWAMTVDLSRCTGCSACVTACYSENNIPTVGASWQGRALSPTVWDTRPGANILKGREMAWIRLERYFEGAPEAETVFDPAFDTRFVPMMCQHCGNAPCEPVCPVYATYHSPDGLNVQVYNRCVGTRYCSNNCPYKVRYYNWFGYGEPERRQYAFPEPMQMQLNPDVTVRGKGVMEKCTFCVQRIREAETRADLEHRPLQGDEFTTACAQACPSKAITFGDAADPAWTVAKQVEDERAYHVFEVLNTYTAVVYLKKINHTVEA